jgi:hypothetical protein
MNPSFGFGYGRDTSTTFPQINSSLPSLHKTVIGVGMLLHIADADWINQVINGEMHDCIAAGSTVR